ncbi:MAG: DUF378 domain-containing protein [Candidatus Paceibacterota bacterium]|jgi:uncharacterized membrane protein YuzA (DUF378 family)
MKGLHVVESVLLWIGGLNWGLVGVGAWAGSDWNVVKWLLGSWPWLEALVYVLVGLSALHMIFTHKGVCKMCESKPMGM